MYSNIGGKIKVLAVVYAILLTLWSIIRGMQWLSQEYYIEGVLFIILGPIVSWASSLMVYGFGELIEMTTETRDTLYAIRHKDDMK